MSVSRGYRKVAGNGCVGGIDPLMTPMAFRCPCSEWSEWSQCDSCLETAIQVRTRTSQGDVACPCLTEERECQPLAIGDQLSISPAAARVAINTPFLLAATLPGSDCDAGSPFGAVGFRWLVPQGLELDENEEVLSVGDGVAAAGVYTFEVVARNEAGSGSAQTTVVVYSSTAAFSVDYASDAGAPTQPAADAVALHVQEVLPALARLHKTQLSSVTAAAIEDASRGAIVRVTFYAYLVAADEAGRLLNTLDGGNAKLDVRAAGLQLAPIPASAQQIASGTVPTAGSTQPSSQTTSAPGGNNPQPASKKLASVVVPITLVCLALLAAVIVYSRRQHAKLRSHYMRLGSEGGVTVSAGGRDELFGSEEEEEPEIVRTPGKRAVSQSPLSHTRTRDRARGRTPSRAVAHGTDPWH